MIVVTMECILSIFAVSSLKLVSQELLKTRYKNISHRKKKKNKAVLSLKAARLQCLEQELQVPHLSLQDQCPHSDRRPVDDESI